jgi:hypothetical protein
LKKGIDGNKQHIEGQRENNQSHEKQNMSTGEERKKELYGCLSNKRCNSQKEKKRAAATTTKRRGNGIVL